MHRAQITAVDSFAYFGSFGVIRDMPRRCRLCTPVVCIWGNVDVL